MPLQIHARYTRIEILAALGIGARAKIAAWQSGVYEAKTANADCSAFTLDKSSGGFSPTTRYRDYAISPNPDPLGEPVNHPRRQPHRAAVPQPERDGRTILLFTRLRTDDRAFWFLGPATYRGHVGEKPMAITWELAQPTPRRPVSVVRGRSRLTGPHPIGARRKRFGRCAPCKAFPYRQRLAFSGHRHFGH